METVGGQAVIEGVMMMSKNKIATAVRKENGDILTKVDKFDSVKNKTKILQLPFLRGVISLFEMMYIGIKALTWSANQQDEDAPLGNWEIAGTIIVSLIAALAIFVFLPYGLTYVITQEYSLIFNIIDGIFRLLIFVVYISGIGMMKDIKTIFQYHGAEHKAVNCFEKKKELTTKNVMECSKIHPRCGTSLIVFVLGLSIALFSILKSPVWWVNVGWRIVLIPVIAGISYEVIKFSARRMDNFLLKMIITPGLWTQKLTTNNPTKQQVEVAIKALKEAV
ncbi:DUF1385 domain-containing protein [Nanoarchaeota archaeon]